MKKTFEKEESKVLVYQDYKNFSFNSLALKVFLDNQKPHLNKSLRAAIMKRSRLKNKAN